MINRVHLCRRLENTHFLSTARYTQHTEERHDTDVCDVGKVDDDTVALHLFLSP